MYEVNRILISLIINNLWATVSYSEILMNTLAGR